VEKKMKFLLVLLLSTAAFANENIDEKLQGYVKEFNLVPLTKPNPINRELLILGRDLFHETGLSGNNNISCKDCHHPRIMTHEGIPLSLGEGSFGMQIGNNLRMQGKGRVLARNTPALFNLHNVNVMFWDGRVEMNLETGEFSTPVPLRPEVAKTLKSALAAQAIFPMVDHDEMRGLKGSNSIANAETEQEAWELIVEKIMNIPSYKERFEKLYPGERINIGHFGEALAEFQGQNFFYADTPYDRYIQGNLEALTPKQKVGMDVFFNKGKCGDCHHGEHLSALDYDGVGAPQIGPGKQNGDDYGRYEWDGDEGSKYAFRVPPLRNVALTAPYFHNGSMMTLEQVVEHYDDIKASLESYKIINQFKNYLEPLKDHDHSTNEARYVNLPEDLPLTLNFTEEEEEALVEFMKKGLTDVRLQ
jgi:cytochrome c peroxidase